MIKRLIMSMMMILALGTSAMATGAAPTESTAASGSGDEADPFANLTASASTSEAGVKSTIKSFAWLFAFAPLGVAIIFGSIAFKKAKENSDREDNTKEIAMKVLFGVVLGIVLMIVIYGIIGKGLMGTVNFGDGWKIFVTDWWASVFAVTEN